MGKQIFLLLTLIVWLSASTLSAQQVSEETARQTAAKFINEHAAKLPKKNRKGIMKAQPKAEGLQLVYTQEDQLHESPALYVFEQPKSDGFVIASADECVVPIFGYFEEGNFQEAMRESCCLKAIIEHFGKQIAYARENDIPRYQSMMNEDNDFSPIAPITRNGVEWGQLGDGINDYCPIDKNTGDRCATGCVANTMGILMYHHQWPEHGMGSHSYQPLNVEGMLTANFGETTYRYELMGPYGSSETALLLYHCGVAVDMDYSSNGSGSYLNRNNSMKSFFRYDLVKEITGDEYTKISEIHEALSQNNPLCASGQNHSFLIDGYQPGGFIHLNLHSGFACGYVHISGLKDGWYDSGGTWNAGSNFNDGSTCYIELYVPEEDVKTITITKDNIEYAVRFNKATITKGTGTGNVVIPSSISDEDGIAYPVTSIGYKAFEGCSNLTSVTIPNSVTSIGDEAFGKCSGLTSIAIPNSVTTISIRAFYGCRNLTSVTIPNSVTTIGRSAFSDCSGLTSISIPNSVTSIGRSAFSDCSGLTNISVDSGNTKYDSRDNCNAIIETASNTLIQGCKNTIIPNTVTSIGDEAFKYNYGLTGITIPNSVTTIGSYAFKGCSNLTSVTIPNSVTTICNEAFSFCSSLTNITIPNSVTSVGNGAFAATGIFNNSEDGVFYVDKWVCGYKGTMPANTNIVLREGTVGISDYAFRFFSDLTSITIPNSVTTIGIHAFTQCSGLTSITFGNSLKSIGEAAFSFCNLTSVTIPNSVTNIGDYAFYGYNALTSVSSYIENPYAITEDVFGSWNGNTYDAPLYVPIGTSEKYKSTDGWKNFKNIVELEILGIDDIYSDSNNHEAKDANRWYSVDGVKLPSEPTQKGIYIRNGKKVMVK